MVSTMHPEENLARDMRPETYSSTLLSVTAFVSKDLRIASPSSYVLHVETHL